MKLNRRSLFKRCLFTSIVLVGSVKGAAGQSSDAPLVKPREVLMTVTVTTENGGFPINGLKPDQFKIYSDKKRQDITSFSDNDEPISIAFLMDVSGSMSGGHKNGNDLRLFLRSIAKFIDDGNEANEYGIVSFNNETRLALDWTQDKTVATQALNRIAGQPAQGYTALYDACQMGLDLMSRSKNRRRVIILLSDGQDDSSKDAHYRKIRDQIRASDIILYSIAIGYLNDGKLNQQGEGILEELVSPTGGLALFPLASQPDLDASFELIGRYLRAQYVVGIKVVGSAAGKWHPLKIELKLPPNAPRELKYLVVRHRAGYFDRVEQP